MVVFFAALAAFFEAFLKQTFPFDIEEDSELESSSKPRATRRFWSRLISVTAVWEIEAIICRAALDFSWALRNFRRAAASLTSSFLLRFVPRFLGMEGKWSSGRARARLSGDQIFEKKFLGRNQFLAEIE